MIRIRLQRRGKKNYATFRVVVADQHAPIKGRFIADVGHYNPHSNEFVVKSELIDQWIKKGALATPTVHNLLITHGVIKGEKKTSWKPKSKKGAEEASGPAKAPAAGSDLSNVAEPANTSKT